MQSKWKLRYPVVVVIAIAVCLNLSGCGNSLKSLFKYKMAEEVPMVREESSYPVGKTGIDSDLDEASMKTGKEENMLQEDNKTALEEAQSAPAIPEMLLSFDVNNSACKGTMHCTVKNIYRVTNIYDANLSIDKITNFDSEFGHALDSDGNIENGILFMIEVYVENEDAVAVGLNKVFGEELDYCFFYNTLFEVHILRQGQINGNIISEDAEYFSSRDDIDVSSFSISNELPEGILSNCFELVPGESKAITLGYFVKDEDLQHLYLFDKSVYSEEYNILAHVVF